MLGSGRDWARDALGARFILAEGVVHVAQSETALAAGGAAIPGDPWRLGALHSVTTLTGSALLALAIAHGRVTADEAWEAAHVDEDWNMEQWGRDELALERRAYRYAELQAAAAVVQNRLPECARGSGSGDGKTAKPGAACGHPPSILGFALLNPWSASRRSRTYDAPPPAAGGGGRSRNHGLWACARSPR